MSDWERFVAEVSWFVQPGEKVDVGTALPWTRGGVDGLPVLSDLLASATVTPVSVGGRAYEVVAWGPSEGRRGWLCHPPVAAWNDAVHPIHREFWKVCGGIVERFGEPPSWWSNQNEVLTVAAAEVRAADVLDAYSWLWEDSGLDLPIDPAEYSVVAVEANGNLTLAHRTKGDLLLFAPDHSFEGVTDHPACPPYSLLTIDAAPDLPTWIDLCADAWRG
ncbi:hypothetical protein [Kribbella amoyensis]|nr:hypothetical protein [Kribbella amoyensis]